MQVRLKKAWRNHIRGAILSPPDGAARLMISRGIAEPVEVETETATMPMDDVETATATRPAKRKRKR